MLLEGGAIQESGTHEELMEANGQYAHMFEVQSQYYSENPDRNAESQRAYGKKEHNAAFAAE